MESNCIACLRFFMDFNNRITILHLTLLFTPIGKYTTQKALKLCCKERLDILKISKNKYLGIKCV